MPFHQLVQYRSYHKLGVEEFPITSKWVFSTDGDIVMADRGFNVADELALCGAHLVIPAFTRGKAQLSKEKTRQIARVRIHVERVIGQMRKKYKILQHTLPIKLIQCPSDSDKPYCMIDKIITVTAALTNLSPSVVPK